MSDFMNLLGRFMMAASFIPMGIITLKFANHSDHMYRRRLTYLYGIAVLTAGLSRAAGLIAKLYPQLEWLDGVFAVISGTTAIISLIYMPVVIRELLRVKTMIETTAEIETTKVAVDKLSEIIDQVDQRHNVSNPKK